jgi:hypothetical protein
LVSLLLALLLLALLALLAASGIATSHAPAPVCAQSKQPRA